MNCYGVPCCLSSPCGFSLPFCLPLSPTVRSRCQMYGSGEGRGSGSVKVGERNGPEVDTKDQKKTRGPSCLRRPRGTPGGLRRNVSPGVVSSQGVEDTRSV